MADVEDGVPPVAQRVQDVEEPRAVRGGQGGGRLVEDEEFGPVGQGAGDGDQGAFGGGQVGDGRVGGRGARRRWPGPRCSAAWSAARRSAVAAGVAGAQGDVLATVIHSTRARSWWMKDIRRAACSVPSGWPATVTSPASGRCTPARILMRVDFPAPLGPRRARTLPPWMSRPTESSARVPPNRLRRPRIRTRGGSPGDGGGLFEVTGVSCTDFSGAAWGVLAVLRDVEDATWTQGGKSVISLTVPSGARGRTGERAAARPGQAASRAHSAR
ncbi:hypothetical protein SF23_17110 [Streptomyces sp. MBRL 10]|nr:hypothetical protein SF23_17110 [Streptomyces sp. MBRL 10]